MIYTLLDELREISKFSALMQSTFCNTDEYVRNSWEKVKETDENMFYNPCKLSLELS